MLLKCLHQSFQSEGYCVLVKTPLFSRDLEFHLQPEVLHYLLVTEGKYRYSTLNRPLSAPKSTFTIALLFHIRPYMSTVHKELDSQSFKRLQSVYESVSKCFRTGRLERELRMVLLSATRCSCIAILWVSPTSFAAITLYVTSQRAIPKVSAYFVIDSVRKLLDTHPYSVKLLGCVFCGS
jgi:hypothetical protein